MAGKSIHKMATNGLHHSIIRVSNRRFQIFDIIISIVTASGIPEPRPDQQLVAPAAGRIASTLHRKDLFPLDGTRRFAGYVVDHAGDFLDLVHDAAGNMIEGTVV